MLTPEESWQAALDYTPHARKLAHSINWGRSRAYEDADLLQEGLIEYARVARKYRPGIGCLNGYAYLWVRARMVAIARRGLRCYERADQKELWQWDEAIDAATFEKGAATETLAARMAPVHAAMARLTNEERCVIEWFYLEENTLPEIARRLGRRHYQGIWIIKQRALARLRRWLKCG